jgi:hypothetical protein
MPHTSRIDDRPTAQVPAGTIAARLVCTSHVRAALLSTAFGFSAAQPMAADGRSVTHWIGRVQPRIENTFENGRNGSYV